MLQIVRALDGMPKDAQGNTIIAKASAKRIIEGLLGCAFVTDELSVVVDAQIKYPDLERQS